MTDNFGNLTPLDIENIGVIAAKHLMTSGKNRLSEREAYRELLKSFYAELDPQNDELRPRGGAPSFDVFKKHVERLLRVPAAVERREGSLFYPQQIRPALHRPGQDSPGPGIYYQIDSTELHLTVVSTWDYQQPIGRPVLYVVRDWWSGLIAGVFVSLSKPSHKIAAQALLCAFMPKKELCARFGITLRHAAVWDVSGMCAVIIADRSEMIKKVPGQWVDRLGITIANLPPRRPDWKGPVEIAMSQVQSRGIRRLPSALTPEERKRGVKATDPCLTLRDIWRVVLRTVISLNRRQIPADDLPPVALKSGRAVFTHNTLHQWGGEVFGILPQAVDDEWLRLRLMPHDPCKATSRGIRCNGLLYECTRGIDEGWFLRKRRRHAPQLCVAWNPLNVSEAFIVDERSGRYEPLTLLGAHRAYAGLAVDEAVAYRKILLARGREGEFEDIWQTINAQDDIREIVNERRREDRKIQNAAAAADLPPAPKVPPLANTASKTLAMLKERLAAAARSQPTRDEDRSANG